MQRITGFTLFVAALLSSCAGFSQATPDPGHLITLNVAVTAKDGQPVAGLTANDFAVSDNKKAQPITSFRELKAQEAPTQVVLLIDAVNTSYLQLAFERDQIEHFLAANNGHLLQPTAIAIMTDTGTQVQPGFTQDGAALRKSFDSYEIGLRELRRSSGFYGAEERSQISLQALSRLITHFGEGPGRKVFICLSPGWPLLSGPEVNLSGNQQRQIFAQVVSLSTQLRQKNITLDAVNPTGAADNPGWLFYYEQFVKPVRKPSQTDLADLGLQVLALQSGGLVLNASNDITGLLQHAMDETRVSYEISYGAPPAEGQNAFHEVDVKVDKPGLAVHTINGYYAQPNVPANVPMPTVVPTGR
jgi:VWFA-related protein